MENDYSLRVPYALAVHGKEELKKITQVLDQHRTGMGKEVEEFEASVARYFGKKYGIMVNSGSSANLIAIEILNFPPGTEVITPLLTFSTTVAPLIQKGLVPVFADVEPGRYFINLDQLEKLITKKTKALMIPLLLGNIPDLERLRKIAKKYNLVIIEDSCDTLGGTFNGKPTGEYSDISTTSFYGSHIITAGGGGGMILVNDPKLRDQAKVFRGWGRSSSLFGESESIEKRFKTKVDGIPYDAKFIFGAVGYNFMPMEISAAFGNAQIKKLEKFRKIRERNFDILFNYFKKYEEIFILPDQDKRVKTQWLGFPLTIKKNAKFDRLELVRYLEENNIQTRPIFTGNILRQPGFTNIPHKLMKGNKYPVTNEIMERGLVIGCHQGLEIKHLDKIKRVFTDFLKQRGY